MQYPLWLQTLMNVLWTTEGADVTHQVLNKGAVKPLAPTLQERMSAAVVMATSWMATLAKVCHYLHHQQNYQFTLFSLRTNCNRRGKWLRKLISVWLYDFKTQGRLSPGISAAIAVAVIIAVVLSILVTGRPRNHHCYAFDMITWYSGKYLFLEETKKEEELLYGHLHLEAWEWWHWIE